MNYLLLLIIIQLSILIYLMNDLKTILIRVFELKWKADLEKDLNKTENGQSN